MEDLISDLVKSVINGFKYLNRDFTYDLSQTFISKQTNTIEEARDEWNRYAIYRRGIDLIKARNNYYIYRDENKLIEEFMEAYYQSDLMIKQFDKK